MAEHFALQQHDNFIDDLIDGERRLQRVGLLGKGANPPDDLGCAIAVVDYVFRTGVCGRAR
jgi:hypothetical protein